MGTPAFLDHQSASRGHERAGIGSPLQIAEGQARGSLPVAGRRAENFFGSESPLARFRRQLENRTTNEYLPAAQALHQLLIAPYLDRLESSGVTTLVFVPDGLLNTVPMAALHDGDRFLADRFAVAVTPGLSLIAPAPLGERNDSALLVGVSDSVGAFDRLPHVPDDRPRLVLHRGNRTRGAEYGQAGDPVSYSAFYD